MEAAVYYRSGDPEVLRREDIPEPALGSSDVLIASRRSAWRWYRIDCSAVGHGGRRGRIATAASEERAPSAHCDGDRSRGQLPDPRRNDQRARTPGSDPGRQMPQSVSARSSAITTASWSRSWN